MTLLPLTLAAADAKITELTEKFGVNLPGFLAQIVNFSILAFVLYRFAIKPALGQLEVRTAMIEKGLADAEAASRAKLDAERRREELLTQAAQEAATLVSQASATAKRTVEEAKAAAASEAAEVLRRGKIVLDAERVKMLAEVRVEVARLVVATTAKVIDQSLDDAAKTRVNDAAVKALAN